MILIVSISTICEMGGERIFSLPYFVRTGTFSAADVLVVSWEDDGHRVQLHVDVARIIELWST